MVEATSSNLLPFGGNELFRNDDRSSDSIDITSIFEGGINIGDTNYTSLFVNTNGNITFGQDLGTFTPQPIGTGTGERDIIAPFWADVDTRGTDDAAKNVFWDFNTDRDSFVVTWNDVGYYNQNQDKENTFQLELADSGNGDVQIVFRYTDVNWTTGDASSGTDGLGGDVARAGFAFGQDLSFELPASGNQNAILGLEANPGNTGFNGLWDFDIRGGELINVGTAGDDNLAGGDSSDSIFGNDGDDFIDALLGNDFIYGGNGADELIGGLGNDFLSGGLGSDILNGGEGFDIADCLAYDFDPNAYTFNSDGSVTLNGEGGDVDTLFGIESVAFADGNLRFDTGALESFGAAYRFYTSILNREPDPEGLDFYVDILDRGVSLFDVAEDISTSEEFIATFGSDLETEAFLGRVYENILNRTPDQAGLDFWANAINTNEVTRSEAVVYISEDDESREITIDVIGSGYFVQDFA